LRRVGDLGLDQQTAPAILLAPLVQVAWAEGNVSDAERNVVVELAEARGVTPGTPPHDTLLQWLKQRPSDALFETATEVMRVGFAALAAEEREERITSLVDACRRVAEASGGTLTRLLGMGQVSGDESMVLDAIAAKLRADPR
jgi:tellurite resistance protein